LLSWHAGATFNFVEVPLLASLTSYKFELFHTKF